MKMTFEEWYKEVDRQVISLCMMSRDDLPDCCYADWYDEGATPKQAARRAIRSAKGGE
jgi:hypothetical protein